MLILLAFISLCESRESICCDNSHSQTSKQRANMYKVKTRETLHTASALLCTEASCASEREHNSLPVYENIYAIFCLSQSINRP